MGLFDRFKKKKDQKEIPQKQGPISPYTNFNQDEITMMKQELESYHRQLKEFKMEIDKQEKTIIGSDMPIEQKREQMKLIDQMREV